MKSNELRTIIEKILRGENITLQELAEKAEVGRSNLSTLINKEKNASWNTVNRIAKAFPAYFKEANEKAARVKVPLPPNAELDNLRINATLQALLQHYAVQIEALTGKQAAQVTQEVLEKAIENLSVRIK